MMDKIISFVSSPLNIAYLVFIILGVSLMVYGVAGATIERRKNILQRISEDHQFQHGFIDKMIDKIPFLVKREEKLDKQIAVLDVPYKARTFTKLELACAMLAIAASIHFKNALVVIPLTVIFVNAPITFIEMKVSKRVRLYNDQVLEAFQTFITDYTTTKSVQKTIVNICPKLKYPLRKEFERLGRKLNSGEPIESCFVTFAERTQNKWTMIFSQMMITYFRNGGDFTPHLLNITKNITSEKILVEQNNTELSSMRMMNIAMNALVPIAYVSNRVINPDNARVFVDTPTGKIIMFGVVLGSLISLYMGKKISDA